MTSILFKNFLDCSLGAVVWFTVGYAFAFGSSHDQVRGMTIGSTSDIQSESDIGL